MLPSPDFNAKSRLISLSVHHNEGGRKVFAVFLCVSEGSYVVLLKSGRTVGEMKVRGEAIYFGGNAILAKDAYGKEIQKIRKTAKGVPPNHWMHTFIVKDYKSSGAFSKSVLTGKPPVW